MDSEPRLDRPSTSQNDNVVQVRALWSCRAVVFIVREIENDYRGKHRISTLIFETTQRPDLWTAKVWHDNVLPQSAHLIEALFAKYNIPVCHQVP